MPLGNTHWQSLVTSLASRVQRVKIRLFRFSKIPANQIDINFASIVKPSFVAVCLLFKKL